MSWNDNIYGLNVRRGSMNISKHLTTEFMNLNTVKNEVSFLKIALCLVFLLLVKIGYFTFCGSCKI